MPEEIDRTTSDPNQSHFSLTDTTSKRVYDCRIIRNDDGTVNIWLPYGIRVSKEEGYEVSKLLRRASSEGVEPKE